MGFYHCKQGKVNQALATRCLAAKFNTWEDRATTPESHCAHYKSADGSCPSGFLIT